MTSYQKTTAEKLKERRERSKKNKEEELVYGNMDTAKKHPFPKNFRTDHLNTKKLSFVILQWSKIKTPTGVLIDDPGSFHIKPYDEEVMMKWYYEPMDNNEPTEFAKMGFSIEILHDPLKDK